MNIVDFIRNPPSRFSFLTNQAIVHTSVKNQTDLPIQKKSINIKKNKTNTIIKTTTTKNIIFETIKIMNNVISYKITINGKQIT
jgi:hypothetical protein